METKASTAFAVIPELVELTLLELPLRDILRAQQTSRTWQGIIKGSPKLQQALFMRPSTNVERHLIAHEGRELPKCTSRSDCTGFTNMHFSAFHCHAATTSGRDATRLVLNPFVEPDLGDHSSRGYFFGSLPDFMKDSISASSSWRSMLLTQPPMTQLLVGICDADHWHVLHAKPASAGVTMLDLAETTMAFASGDEVEDRRFHAFSHTGWKLPKRDATTAGLVLSIINEAEQGSSNVVPSWAADD